jgi:hypothetical protein
MFKVYYDDTKRSKRKSKQRQKEKLNAALAEKKLFNKAHHVANALVKIYFLLFSIFVFFNDFVSLK